MKESTTIKKLVQNRIARKKSAVVLREDFRDLGGYDQVGRALMQLSRNGNLVHSLHLLLQNLTTSLAVRLRCQ